MRFILHQTVNFIHFKFYEHSAHLISIYILVARIFSNLRDGGLGRWAPNVMEGGSASCAIRQRS